MATLDPIEVMVDGHPVTALPGTRLLDVLRGLGLRIPTLCHDDRLTPYGGCRLCVVTRRDGRGGLVLACSTPVLPGMVIETHTPEVVEARRQQLQLLLLNHRLECPICDRRGDCRLQELMFEHGVSEQPYPFERPLIPRDESSPVITRDPEKCILCGKCVRLCDEVQGVAAIGIVHRGLQARVTTLLDRPLDCEFCGQCVNNCPVSALVARPYLDDTPAWLREPATTTCAFCSCGCQVTGETWNGALVRVTGAGVDEPNRGKLCAKGWLGWDVHHAPDRLTHPLVRRDGRLMDATWAEALDAVVGALRRARDAGHRIVGLGGSRLSCEDAYAMQRLMRTAAATPHIGLGPAGGARALVEGMGALTGAPRSTATFDDVRSADVVLVLRGDPARTHPLLKTELVQGVTQRGQTLVLAHALSGPLDRHATVRLPVHPASEAALLHGVAARLLALDPGLASRVHGIPGAGEWLASLAAYDAETVVRQTGLDLTALDALASVLGHARTLATAVITGLGIPGDEAAVTRAAVALDALVGGRGVMVLGEKANLQGVIDAGLHGEWLPGGRPTASADARAEVGVAWGQPVPPPAPVPLLTAIQADGGDPVGVLYVAGQDPAGAWPGGLRGTEAVAAAAFVVVHDAFMSDTAQQADVVLPVAILGERAGSLVAADGVRRPLVRLEPPPRAVPQDRDIFREVSARLGIAMPEEAALVAEMEALCGWPRPRASVQCLVPAEPPAAAAPIDGLLLDGSPQVFRSGSITDHSARLQELSPSVAVKLSRREAAELNIGDGDTVLVSVGDRAALLRARVDPEVRPGMLVAPWRARWGTAASRMIPGDEPAHAHIRRSS